MTPPTISPLDSPTPRPVSTPPTVGFYIYINIRVNLQRLTRAFPFCLSQCWRKSERQGRPAEVVWDSGTSNPPLHLLFFPAPFPYRTTLPFHTPPRRRAEVGWDSRKRPTPPQNRYQTTPTSPTPPLQSSEAEASFWFRVRSLQPFPLPQLLYYPPPPPPPPPPLPYSLRRRPFRDSDLPPPQTLSPIFLISLSWPRQTHATCRREVFTRTPSLPTRPPPTDPDHYPP